METLCGFSEKSKYKKESMTINGHTFFFIGVFI